MTADDPIRARLDELADSMTADWLMDRALRAVLSECDRMDAVQRPGYRSPAAARIRTAIATALGVEP